MPPANANATVPRRRNRKRKRRAASSSSSSSSSDSDSEEDSPSKPIVVAQPPKKTQSSSSESSDSESDSSSSASSSEDVIQSPKQAKAPVIKPAELKQSKRRLSPSPSPPPANIPSFLPPGGSEDVQTEQMMKDRFRKFWLTTVADGFKDDLEEIRKEPNLGASRLALLIDSLAAGADVFSNQNETGTSEMDIILN